MRSLMSFLHRAALVPGVLVPGVLVLGVLDLPGMIPDAEAVLSKTEMTHAVRGASETGDTAAVDSLLALYPTYAPDVVALLHRFAYDDTTGAGAPYRAAAALTAARARAAGDELPTLVRKTIAEFDAGGLASWRDAERLYLAGVRALQGLAYDEADAALDSAIARYRAIGEQYRLGLAVSYRGLSSLNRGLFDEAEAFLVEASGIQQRSGDTYNRAATLAYRAQILEFLGRYGDALAQYEESLALFQSRRAHQDIAETLHSIASVMTTRGDFRGADDQLALAEALYDTLANPVGLALTQIARGDLARRFGEFEAAAARYESAETEIREHGLEPLAGTLWIARGILLQMLGDHRTAARYYEEAIAAERAIGDTLSVLLSTLNRARALLEAGERTRAAEIAGSVLADSAARPYPSIQRLANETLGDYSVRTNDLKRAVISFERALDNARESGEPEAEADNLMALALVHQKMGATDAAIEGLEKALALFEEMGHLPAVLETKLELADALRLYGDYARARAEARETLKTARLYGDWITESKALFSIASIDYEAGRLEESGARLRGLDSLEYASQLPELSWRFDVLSARIAEDAGDFSLARARLESAVRRIEKLRTTFGGVRDRAGFLEDRFAPYRMLARWHLDHGAAAGAFATIQRLKARNLLEFVARGSSIDSPQPEQLSIARIDVLTDEVRQAVVSGSKEGVQALMRELHVAYAEHERNMATIAGNARPLQPLVVEPGSDPILPALAPGAVLLEYFFLENELVLFLVDANGITSHRVPHGRDDIASRVARARTLLADHRSTPADAYPVLTSLFEILVGPVHEEIAAATECLIVPSGPLLRFPFAALVDPNGSSPDSWQDMRWLADAAPLVYLPHSLLGQPGERDAGPGELVVFADAATWGERLGAGETNAIVKLFPAESVRVFRGRDATEDRWYSEALAGRPSLHFAVHAFVDPALPLYSFLDLAPGGEEDGRLSVYEIMRLELDAPLVFLAACNTAVQSEEKAGGAVAGDEWEGLTGAFLSAGAGVVIGALWAVGDRSTADLATAFYRGLAAGADPAHSLQAATRAVRDDRGPLWARRDQGHPFYWAGFTQTGR